MTFPLFFNPVQARDSYYSGRPLIVDDMFDKVEVNHSSFFSNNSPLHAKVEVNRFSYLLSSHESCMHLLQLKLRLYGSKSVVKYPRCSLIRQSTYADAEVTISQHQIARLLYWLAVFIILSTFGCRAGGPVNVYGVV